MKRIVLLLILASTSTLAGVLDDLKSTPATKYDLVKFRLELLATLATQEQKDKRVRGTSFEVERFSVEERETGLIFKASFSGRAKDMNEEGCRTVRNQARQVFDLASWSREALPSLNEQEYASLTDEILLVTELVSTENRAFVIDC